MGDGQAKVARLLSIDRKTQGRGQAIWPPVALDRAAQVGADAHRDHELPETVYGASAMGA